MAGALDSFLLVIRKTLTASLCITSFDSQLVERHNKPEIEVQSSNEVLLQPLIINRTDMQKVKIETSINSVRISVKIKQANEIEKMLTTHFCRFMTRRAEGFKILRRRPADKDYDIAFLITNFHLETMIKDKLVDFICEFIKEVDKEISEMRLMLNSRASLCAKNFLSGF